MVTRSPFWSERYVSFAVSASTPITAMHGKRLFATVSHGWETGGGGELGARPAAGLGGGGGWVPRPPLGGGGLLRWGVSASPPSPAMPGKRLFAPVAQPAMSPPPPTGVTRASSAG